MAITVTDDFTVRHLMAWVGSHVPEQWQDEFLNHAITLVEDDPAYDWNWSDLYHRWSPEARVIRMQRADAEPYQVRY